MICINNDIVLEEKENLEQFIKIMRDEIYDDNTRIVTECIISFLYEVWEQNEKLTEMIHRKISEELYSIVMVEVEETAALDEIRVLMFSLNQDFEILTSQKVAFDQFCNMYFKSVKPLYDRFAELEL